MHTVHVLIPCHNGKEDLLAVLRCLQTQSYRPIHCVVVDDGSTDGSAEAVRQTYPDATVVRGDGTLWWTGANELGLAHILAKADPTDRVLLLNCDLVIDDRYVETLMETGRAYERALVGSALVDVRNAQFMEGGIRLDHRLRLRVNRDRAAIETQPVDLDVDVLPGRGTLVPVEAFRQVGTFNVRRLPHYGADYEFSIRARRAGYRLLVSHRARVYAKLDVTGMECPSGRTLSWRECGTLLFSRKSKCHLVYYLNYVWLCSERPWRLRNLCGSAAGILSSTVGETAVGRPCKYVIQALVRVVSKVYAFLFRAYPLRPTDVMQCGAPIEDLFKMGLLVETTIRGDVYYEVNEALACHGRRGSSEAERAIGGLRKLAGSYRYKLQRDWERMRRLLRKSA